MFSAINYLGPFFGPTLASAAEAGPASALVTGKSSAPLPAPLPAPAPPGRYAGDEVFD